MTGYGKTGTTIKDVANEVGLSITAVSQVLNGKDCRISQEKRILIQQKAKELNYQPNRNAVALVTNCTKIIGVILNDISNIYFAEFAKGAEDIASENGYQLLLVNMQNRWNKPKSFANLLGYDTTDGLIITRDLDTPELKNILTLIIMRGKSRLRMQEMVSLSFQVEILFLIMNRAVILLRNICWNWDIGVLDA